MAEFKQRPKVGTVDVEVEIDPKKLESRVGADLNDVLRAILWDQQKTADWSTLEFARRLGIPKSTLQGILDEDEPKGTSLHVLSMICAAEKINPDALFQAHESYRPEDRDGVRYAEDAVFDRFRALLTVGQAKEALAVLDVVKRQGTIDEYLKLEKARLGIRRQPAQNLAKRRRR